MKIAIDATALLLPSAGVKNYVHYWLGSLEEAAARGARQGCHLSPKHPARAHSGPRKVFRARGVEAAAGSVLQHSPESADRVVGIRRGRVSRIPTCGEPAHGDEDHGHHLRHVVLDLPRISHGQERGGHATLRREDPEGVRWADRDLSPRAAGRHGDSENSRGAHPGDPPRRGGAVLRGDRGGRPAGWREVRVAWPIPAVRGLHRTPQECPEPDSRLPEVA